MTPREFDAHVKLFEREDFTVARLLAALHNGAWVRKDQQAWTPQMFMPDYSPAPADPALAAESANLNFALLKARMNRPKQTPETIAAQAMIAHRIKRAQAATEAGESGERVRNIMMGIL